MTSQCLSFPHGKTTTEFVIPAPSSLRSESELLWAAAAQYLRDLSPSEGISFSSLRLKSEVSLS